MIAPSPFSDERHRETGDGTVKVILLPTSAEGFIEVDNHQLFVAHGVAQRHLGVEVVTLGVQKVQVTDDPVDVLQLCQLHCVREASASWRRDS